MLLKMLDNKLTLSKENVEVHEKNHKLAKY